MNHASQRAICFVGPFPAPTHGQSASTAHLHDTLKCAGLRIARFDTGGGTGGKVAQIFSKISAFSAAAFWLLVHKQTAAYISVHARNGMPLTTLLLRIARFRGHRIFLHHHTRSHLSADTSRLDFLAKNAGPDAIHITICETMSAMTIAASCHVKHVINLSNVGVVNVSPSIASAKIQKFADRPQDSVKSSRSSVVLGHMSNLSVEKGLGRVIDAFSAAKKAGLADRLILAGPAENEESQSVIEKARHDLGDLMDWRGPVYGTAKETFFKDIDVFLFPSLYVDETQGIVNLEALATGTPVLAYNLCCIGDDLQGGGADAIKPDQEFTPATLQFLSVLPRNAQMLAHERFQVLMSMHQKELEQLISMLKRAVRV